MYWVFCLLFITVIDIIDIVVFIVAADTKLTQFPSSYPTYISMRTLSTPK